VSVALLAGAVRAEEPIPPPPREQAPKRWQPDDKRRTLRSYGSNLAYNLLGVWTPGNYPPLLVSAAVTVPSFAWDDDGIEYFGRHPHRNFANIGKYLGGGLAVGGLTVGFFSAGRLSRGDRFRASTYDVSQAVIVTQVYTQLVKFTVRRRRPDGSNSVSFPSGHASNAFAGATAIGSHYPKLRIPGYAVATYIALSRMAANKHHFSDVVAGAGLGYSIGRVVVRRNGRPPDAGAKDPGGPQVGFDAGPSGDGRGIAVTFVF
jgi:hypothetical protein